MKKSLLVLGTCALMSAFAADASVYLVGEPAGSWSPQVGIEMEAIDGGFQWTGTIGDNQWFAFATQLLDSDDWEAFNSTYRLNPPSNGTVTNPGDYALTLGGTDCAFKGNGTDVTFFIKEVDGSYTLTVSEATPLPLPENSLYIIGQVAGEWSPMIGTEMEKIPGGWKWSGYVADTDYFAFASQLLDTPDWDVFNANYRISPVSDGAVAYDGTYEMHLGNPEGSFCGVGSDATYIVKEIDGGYTLTVSGAPKPLDLTWGVVGDFNGWGESEDSMMTEIRKGVWKATLYDFSGEFKFRANSNWDFNYGSDSFDVTAVENDGDFGVALNGGNFNIPEEAEEVILLLDLNEQKLTVDGLTPSFLALRGSFIDWNFEWSYLFQEVDDDVYMLYLDGVEKDWQFKIADQDWADEYTTDILDMKADEMYELKPGAGLGNMGVDNDYSDVTMFFNLEEGLFWFYGEVASGVALNEIAAGKARYFNLQGYEVANPSAGCFIRVIDGKSEKIVVK